MSYDTMPGPGPMPMTADTPMPASPHDYAMSVIADLESLVARLLKERDDMDKRRIEAISIDTRQQQELTTRIQSLRDRLTDALESDRKITLSGRY